MAIRRAPRPDTRFYTLNKDISEDLRLSWGARGLLIYLLGKPDNWEVSVASLINQTADSGKPAGRDAVRGLLKELSSAGYLQAEKKRADGGSFDGMSYVVCESSGFSPETDYPAPAKPATGEPAPANPLQVSNEYKQVLNTNKNTLVPSDDGTPVQPKKDDYSTEFEKLWAEYPKREGSNPKNKAYQAWNARRKAGVTSEAMSAGLQRYVAFCGAKGQVGTSYVMQASRFFGPGLEFNNAWTVNSQPAQSGVKRHSDTAADLEGRSYETRIGWKNNTQEGRQ